MSRISKRVKTIAAKIDGAKSYTVDAAITLLAELSTVKFIESVEVAINLGVDPRKSDQVVRGSVVMPSGTGKTVRVAVFTGPENEAAAKAAGADFVGLDDLAETVKNGELDVDVVIASPDAMRVIGKIGQILGPKGLMPNPKDGTVSQDVAAAVKAAKSGQVRFRTDKNGIIHCGIGKINFSLDAIKENLKALIAALHKLKPTGAKGIYIKKISLSSTMGPGLTVEISSVDA
jgi:large subunit ribosomal protein L1